MVAMAVAGTYFYARKHIENALKEVPNKIGLDIQQTAQGFSVSKSEKGRTLFKMEASRAVQFKQRGWTELHDVQITVYGKDSSRFDRITGKDFEYDPQSGDVTANGEVNIDLAENPQAAGTADQSAPTAERNAIHIVTSGLVFNQKTGDAATKEKVNFELPQAAGSAQGLSYSASESVLKLGSDIKVGFSGETSATVTASEGEIRKDSDSIKLKNPRVTSGARRLQADEATVFLRPDNTISRTLLTGNVEAKEADAYVEAARIELIVDEANEVRTADLSGEVRFGSSSRESSGKSTQSTAGRVMVAFAKGNQPVKAHAQDGVKLVQKSSSSGAAGGQETTLTAAGVDMDIADGEHIRKATTVGSAEIEMRPRDGGKGDATKITAGKFDAKFDDDGELTSLHGAPNAKVVSRGRAHDDRISTGDTLDVGFRPRVGVQWISQQGHVAYHDGERTASANEARYNVIEQTLALTGSPRVTDRGMATTAQTLNFNRATGEMTADGNVKSSYSELKPQAGAGLPASSSPVYVTSRTMVAKQNSGTAAYSGDARLWQDANVVEAGTIEFDRNNRSVVAQSSGGKAVSTRLEKVGDGHKAESVEITADKLAYQDGDRDVRFSGGVMATAADVTVTSRQMDCFLTAAGAGQKTVAAGKLDRIEATGSVVITQPQRHATGEKLLYTAKDDKFILTGGPPSIFDAEHGHITGVSLTLYRHDDRVQINGNTASPAVTQTRVAR